ncbi:mucin-associated surface protein (MASP) [Trypanosoma cruzi]|nr:mucin-associated surface protein (MASP) [Trypanosoma cruzi]
MRCFFNFCFLLCRTSGLQGGVRDLQLYLISSVSFLCALLSFVTVRDTHSWMEQCAVVRDLSLLLLCVDGELVCTESCTQVTGVMTMMMTGRVLLVCALCVLWSVAADGAVGVVSGGDDNILKELLIPVARLQLKQE